MGRAYATLETSASRSTSDSPFKSQGHIQSSLSLFVCPERLGLGGFANFRYQRNGPGKGYQTHLSSPCHGESCTHGAVFRENAKAMVLVETIEAMLGLLASIFGLLGGEIVSHEIQVKFFESLTKMEISWWTEHERTKKPYERINQFPSGSSVALYKDFSKFPKKLLAVLRR